MFICVNVRVQCIGLGVATTPSFFFSPLYHHDNLLTPAQPHTANISLPSPSYMFVFLTPSPYTPVSPSYALIYLYSLHSLPSSSLSGVSSSCPFPSLAFSSSRYVFMQLHLKESLLPGCHLCRKSDFYLCSSLFFTSVLYLLLPADCL